MWNHEATNNIMCKIIQKLPMTKKFRNMLINLFCLYFSSYICTRLICDSIGILFVFDKIQHPFS